jgi:hypothetical protein
MHAAGAQVLHRLAHHIDLVKAREQFGDGYNYGPQVPPAAPPGVGLPPLSAAQQQQQLLARFLLANAQVQAQQVAMAAVTRGVAPPPQLHESAQAALIRLNPATLKGMIYTILLTAGAKVSRQASRHGLQPGAAQPYCGMHAGFLPVFWW